jgi:redox-sensitive bicupin YhaK (pirin superfamily)
MLTVRRAQDRGHELHGWLDTWHTFSFADYHDPRHMGFRALRVINEDRVLPGRGFGMHGHRDMEIVSYVLEGALEHKDSMGNGSVIRPGDVQRMSAGSGVMHSEYNPSKTEPVHFLQIWLQPDQVGIAPSYEQKTFSREERRGRLRLIASPQSPEAVTIHANALVYASVLQPGDRVEHTVRPERHAWIHVAQGRVTAGGKDMGPGDGASTSDSGAIVIEAVEAGGEVLVFDLA